MSALMVAVRCLTLMEAACMDARHFHTTSRNTGMIQAITRASCHWMVNMMTSAPQNGDTGYEDVLRTVVGPAP